jgi:DNA-binding protein H-NS
MRTDEVAWPIRSSTVAQTLPREAPNGYSRTNQQSAPKGRLLAAFPLLSFLLHDESCRCLELAMKDRELEKMKLDDLWDLHQRIIDVLDRKLETEKRKLQDQLDELGRKFGGSPKDIPQRRPYPKVEPKFRNPNDPSETWSGRGKTPRWMIEMIADGRSIDDFRIQ